MEIMILKGGKAKKKKKTLPPFSPQGKACIM